MSTTDQNIPKIDLVPGGTPRPFWSVMIPTFNCAKYLRQTLESVLAQDPGPEKMQIEVVDDVSTKDDPEAVVREIGKGRVLFFRHAENQGATRNFNECIRRSRGRMIHILHGDDYVLDGFYCRIEEASQRFQSSSAFFTRAFYIDELGEIDDLTFRVKELEAGGQYLPPFYQGNPIQTPSVVIRRDFYESHGGFDINLVHCADYEMWSRAAAMGGIVSINAPLAAYRLFSGNDTSRLARTADNLRDYLRVVSIIYTKGRSKFDDLWRVRKYITELALKQAQSFSAIGDMQGRKENLLFWRKHASFSIRCKHYLKNIVSRVRQRHLIFSIR